MRNPISNPEETTPRREPLFGPGAGSLFAHLVTTAVALCLILFVLYLGIATKGVAHRFIYGDPAPAQPTLAPGESTVINGVTIKRVN